MMRGNIPVIVDPAADEGAIDATDWFLQQNNSENIKSLATKNKFPTLSGL
jgi:hypothetical protein